MQADERIKRLFTASLEQLDAIDGILEGKIQKTATATAGPLLMGMTASAKFLGVSRVTLWRMINKGRLKKIELYPGSFRLRRCDLEAIVDDKMIASQ